RDTSTLDNYTGVVRLRVFATRYGPHPLLHSFPTRRSSDLRPGSRPLPPPPGPCAWRCSVLPIPSACRLPCGANSSDEACPCAPRSEEHTSELQSRFDLVSRLLLEKQNREEFDIIQTI